MHSCFFFILVEIMMFKLNEKKFLIETSVRLSFLKTLILNLLVGRTMNMGHPVDTVCEGACRIQLASVGAPLVNHKMPPSLLSPY